MSHTDRQELEAQLEAVRRHPAADPLELCILAGLLARHPAPPALPEPPALSPERLAAEAQRLADAVIDVDFTDLSDAPTNSTHSDHPDHSDHSDHPDHSAPSSSDLVAFDRLAALDELCAAATWVGLPHAVAGPTEDVVAVLQAFPEDWSALSPLASTLLERCPPAPTDPALALWQALEATALPVHADAADSPGAPSAVRIAAGLDVVVSLADFRSPLRRAAAGAIPAPGSFRTLRDAPEAAVGLEADQDVVWLVVQTPPGTSASVSCNGEAVPLTAHLGAHRCRVQDGDWQVVHGDTTTTFRLTDDPAPKDVP